MKHDSGEYAGVAVSSASIIQSFMSNVEFNEQWLLATGPLSGDNQFVLRGCVLELLGSACIHVPAV